MRGLDRYGHLGRKDRRAWLQSGEHRELASREQELEAIYRQTGAGKAPVPPGLMAMATIRQGYLKASDATMVELTVFDLRVQMVLDRMGSTEPAFSLGALCEFRHRLIRNNMDRRLLEKSVEVAPCNSGSSTREISNPCCGWPASSLRQPSGSGGHPRA